MMRPFKRRSFYSLQGVSLFMTFLRTLIVSLFFLIVSLVGATVLAVVAAAIYFAPGLPDVRQLQDFELHTPLRIFTQDGKLIRRIW